MFSLCKIILFAILMQSSVQMHIPEDIEILDGYHMDTTPIEINPEAEYIGHHGYFGPRLYKAIRNRRSLIYKILESTGLHSHFHLETPNDYDKKNVKRFRRTVEETPDEDKVEHRSAEEVLPTAEKLVLPKQSYEEDVSAAKWMRAPSYISEFSNVQKNEQDSQADATAINEGIKARAARVNFITQQNKNPETSESRDQKPTIIQDNGISDIYRKPLARIYYENPRPYNQYPRAHDKYDRYERDMIDRMLPPSYPDYDARIRYNDDYDTYYMKGRNLNSYYYPDKRYDLPESRDYRYLYTNEINDRYVPPQPFPPMRRVPYYPVMPSRNRRIIYYANLPEVIRTPPNVDLRYRNFENRYDPYYPQSEPYRAIGTTARIDRVYNTDLSAGSRNYIRATTASPRNNVRKGDYVSTSPIKITSNMRTDVQRNASSNNRVYTENRNGRPSYQDGVEDREHPYFSRHN